MDLNHAIEKHVEWKLRFRSAIAKHETMDADTIGKDNRCELGKWLHGEARVLFSGLQSYPPCVERHAQFHAEAARVAQAINQKRYAEAEAMLGGETPYADASTAVGGAIMRLKREAQL